MNSSNITHRAVNDPSLEARHTWGFFGDKYEKRTWLCTPLMDGSVELVQKVPLTENCSGKILHIFTTTQ